MARPKKSKLSESKVDASTPIVEVKPVEIVNAEVPVIETPAVEIEEVKVAVEELAPAPPPPVMEEAQPKGIEKPEDVIIPEADKHEMDRYFRVINNSEQASRIMDAVSHQRDLQMWGVHQYDNNRSRNSYARSFYFKNRENAVKALEYAQKLLA